MIAGRTYLLDETMKRDMDLVRKIAFALESHVGGWAPHPLVIEGYSASVIGNHVHLMMQAGLVDAVDATCAGDEGLQAIANSLTWSGHDFIDAARSDSLWKKAMKEIKEKVGGASIEVVTGYLKHEGMKALGMA